MGNEPRDEHFPKQGIARMCSRIASREKQYSVSNEFVGKTIQLRKEPKRLASKARRRQIFMNLQPRLLALLPPLGFDSRSCREKREEAWGPRFGEPAAIDIALCWVKLIASLHHKDEVGRAILRYLSRRHLRGRAEELFRREVWRWFQGQNRSKMDATVRHRVSRA